MTEKDRKIQAINKVAEVVTEACGEQCLVISEDIDTDSVTFQIGKIGIAFFVSGDSVAMTFVDAMRAATRMIEKIKL